MIAVRARDNDDPMAGFDRGGIESKIRLLIVKLGDGGMTLDDAIYSLAHPTAPDATPGMTREGVVTALMAIADGSSVFAKIAHNLADGYREEYGLE